MDVTGLGRTGSTAEQIQAAGQLLATALLATTVWDVINPLLSKATRKDNKEDVFTSFGPLTPIDHIRRINNGTGDLTDLIKDAFTLGPAVTAAVELWSNRDLYFGKRIRTWSYDQGGIQNLMRQGAQVVDRLVDLGVAPLQQANGEWRDQKTGTVLPAPLAAAITKRVALSGVGIHRRKTDEATRKTRKGFEKRDFTSGEKHKGMATSGMEYLENVLSVKNRPKILGPKYQGTN